MLNAKQAAARLGISLSLLYSLAAEGRIRHLRIGRNGRRGKLLFAETDLEEFLASCRVEGLPADGAPLRHIR
jgi:excisionase family DNA binding protein